MLLARRANSSMLQRSSANRPSSACLPALRGVDGRGQRGDGGESAHCPSTRPPVRPFVVVGGGGGGLGSGASLHDQLKVASQAPSLPLSL